MLTLAIVGCSDTDGGDDSDERTFGPVSLTVEADTDVFLLAVYDVPTDEEHALSPVLFTLDSGETGVGKNIHRLEFSEPPPVSAAWRARLAFERDRRARLDRLINDLHAGKRDLWPAHGRFDSTCTSACDADQMCWKTQCREPHSTFEVVHPADKTEHSFELVAVLTEPPAMLNVLVEATATDDDKNAAVKAAGDFLSTVPFQLDLFGLSGHQGDLDRDGDGRLTVAISDGPCPGRDETNCEDAFCQWKDNACQPSNAGFFDFFDFLPESDNDATGNQADILWGAIPTTDLEDHLTGTLAHEYTHLISYATRVEARNSQALREVLWLDEGLAHLNEDLTGWGKSNVNTLRQALESWDEAGFANSIATSDTDLQEIVMRGKAMMLLRHMIDQASSGTNAASDATFTAAKTLLSDLLSEEALGFKHSAFQNADQDFLWHYALGVFATGDTTDVTVTAAHAYDFLATAIHPEHVGKTNNITGVNTHGSYTDSLGEEWDFDGPAIDPDREDFDVESEIPYEDELVRSSVVYYLLDTSGVTPGTTMVIHGKTDPNVDLRLAVQKVQE